ncbi:hypothetical protein KQI30_08265 [Clostridium bornimense]|uniref:DUF6483 family protein n=1 Tax=Clostridium bornimense TaxID=1216932 RepID=UPI001C11FEA3|nr:DUF6483 family protein [Clostridium bornimense]MBU5316263.1 hypothetical protein [Clostridium bornimense]
MNFKADELLNLKIRKYIKECKINKAENALFQAIKVRQTKENLKTALLFYEEISKWDNEKLIQSNFSKSEIEQGLNDLKKIVC